MKHFSPTQKQIAPKSQHSSKSLGIVACGALAREIEVIVNLNNLQEITVKYLPAKLHNSPNEIPEAVDAALKKLGKEHNNLFVAYGDCGTAGKLDAVLKKHGATRLNGSHCYEFYAGTENFTALHDAEPGTFYLTDYLARQFDVLVYKSLGLDKHPQLLKEYFGNYTRLLFLSQSDDKGLEEKAREAAIRLELRFEKIHVGFGTLQTSILAEAEITNTENLSTGNLLK